MGHQHRPGPPEGASWLPVRAAIQANAPAAQVLEAMNESIGRGLRRVESDNTLTDVVKVLATLSLQSARERGWPESLSADGVPRTPAGAGGALASALDASPQPPTHVVEIGRLAAVTGVVNALRAPAGPLQSHPFERVAGPVGFGAVTERFFAAFTEHYVGTLLARELPDHTGDGRRFWTLRDQVDFRASITSHISACCSGIASDASDWMSRLPGGRDPDDREVGTFVRTALQRVRGNLFGGSR